MRSERRTQRDLFEQETILPDLPPGLRTKLTPLLQALLMEAASQRSRAAMGDTNGKEDSDDQDHA